MNQLVEFIWINTHIMSMFTALLLFGLGCSITYALVYLKDRENNE